MKNAQKLTRKKKKKFYFFVSRYKSRIMYSERIVLDLPFPALQKFTLRQNPGSSYNVCETTSG